MGWQQWKHKTLLSICKQYVDKEPDRTFLIVGLPTQTNGLPSENQKRVLAFSEKLRKNFPTFPFLFTMNASPLYWRIKLSLKVE